MSLGVKMKQIQSLKLVGIIAGLSLIAVMGVNLLPQSENQTDTTAKNYIPRPPPSLMESYGVDVNPTTLQEDAQTSWIKSSTYVPGNFVLNSIQKSHDGKLVTYTYNLAEMHKRLDTLEANYNNGIVVLYEDSEISYDQFIIDSKEQITYDPLKRYFKDIDGISVYVEEGEDAYEQPARVYVHDGKHLVTAISSVAHISDLTQMVRTTMN